MRRPTWSFHRFDTRLKRFIKQSAVNFPALSGAAGGGGGGGGTVVEPYIIVQPEFSAPVGMRNRLCHELHLCHCDPECDISHPVSTDHVATTGCR